MVVVNRTGPGGVDGTKQLSPSGANGERNAEITHVTQHCCAPADPAGSDDDLIFVSLPAISEKSVEDGCM